ncbi:MAG TPA: DUF2779 domain-containing protein [Candidatus Nanoarchaeia archaeon]|nr:DUF2779 domain-containing protein [Candidatus Nanoarchaeia archaeon]
MTSQKKVLLTKSRYVTGLKCSKYIWLAFNNSEELPKIDDATQHRFDEGHKIGELAKELFPKGIEIVEKIPVQNDKASREALKRRVPLFEAGFLDETEKCYARADILVPVKKDEWDIYEVKSATEVKEEYIWDLAFQKYCYESAGIKIRNCFIVHVNNEYVRQGEVNPKELFITAPIYDEVDEESKNVKDNIKKLFEIVSLKECPEFKKGEEYHNDDFGVHENDLFWKEHPECDIFELYRGGKKSIELFNSEIYEIGKLEGQKLNEKQQIQFKTHKSGKEHVDKREIKNFLDKLVYPLYFLDFESYNTAIPLYNGLKPYQQIPFQFSLHIVKKEGTKPEHIYFIAEGSEDPRPEFIKVLKENLGDKGSIIVYNQTFEQTVLNKLGDFLPLYKEWVASTVSRMVDLLMPFRNFSYYHPKQQGSASIKKVLPVLTGKSYENFEIANGGDASLSYLFITHGSYDGEKATSEEIKKVRDDLEKYCCLDTEGMIWILEKIREKAE